MSDKMRKAKSTRTRHASSCPTALCVCSAGTHEAARATASVLPSRCVVKAIFLSCSKQTAWPPPPPSARIQAVRDSMSAASYSSSSKETLGLIDPEVADLVLASLSFRRPLHHSVLRQADSNEPNRPPKPPGEAGGLGAGECGTLSGAGGGRCCSRWVSHGSCATTPPLIRVAMIDTGRSRQKVGDHGSTLNLLACGQLMRNLKRRICKTSST
mmetsp:Transcript_86103/g.238599  ORF Transcript_86103/g.238599 Transcript_86103/m.238599 type:complete len:213 (+) Transcript_86103:301-939(+)